MDLQKTLTKVKHQVEKNSERTNRANAASMFRVPGDTAGTDLTSPKGSRTCKVISARRFST